MIACRAGGSQRPFAQDIHFNHTAPFLNERHFAKRHGAIDGFAVQLEKRPDAAGVRLAVAPAGCSGLRYRVDPIDALREDDVVVFECRGLRVAVDRASLPFVQGTTVRLAHEGLARRLRFDNPNARQSCGCGESFGL